jgi:hypothetical protein
LEEREIIKKESEEESTFKSKKEGSTKGIEERKE